MGLTFTKDEQPTLVNFNKRFGDIYSKEEVLTSINTGWEILAEYATAGSYTWTAPDLYGGKSYKIGVLIVGGGGSGGVSASDGSSSTYYTVFGGSSGFSQVLTMIVSPGSTYAVVVGAGGDSVTTSDVTTSTAANGTAGGSSSFDGVVANGGYGGTLATATSVPPSGAQTSLYQTQAQWGGQVTFIPNSTAAFANITGQPRDCFNPFEATRILGGGGSATSGTTYKGYSGGKDPITGEGGGDGSAPSSGSSIGSDATAMGCGGGGAAVKVKSSAAYSATSGKGHDGAVKIYYQGGQA